jgi:prolipoprotein diacylglyceryltransferase
MTEMGLITWYIVKVVLNVGPFGVAAFLGVIIAAAFCAGYFFGRRKPKGIAMSHQIPLHGKTDILPDGSNTPVDIFN